MGMERYFKTLHYKFAFQSTQAFSHLASHRLCVFCSIIFFLTYVIMWHVIEEAVNSNDKLSLPIVKCIVKAWPAQV